MGCNSNTMPLIDENDSLSCNNGCTPKYINVVCKKIIIPNGQKILGVQGDTDSISRTFIVPNSTEQGSDLTDKIFFIVVQNENGEQWEEKVPEENIEKSETYVKIKWMLKPKDTQVAGSLLVSLKAELETFVWQTYMGEFLIQKSIIDPGEVPIPLNLQDKTVKPTTEEQTVSYDEGYQGLDKVTILPIELQSKDITKNGTYKTDNGYDGFGEVSVNVQPNLGEKYISKDGTYIAKDEELDGYSKVQVAVGEDISEYFVMEEVYPTSSSETYSLKDFIKKIPLINTKNLRNIESFFLGCRNLIQVPRIDTSNVIGCDSFFFNCENLEEISLLNFASVNSCSYMFSGCSKLKRIEGFKDYGKGFFFNTPENDSYKTIGLGESPLIEHQSLINIFNNLYDLKSNNKKPQKIYLGATNIAKLTEEEIAIATNKGWNVAS